MPIDYYPLQDLLYRTTALTDDAGALGARIGRKRVHSYLLLERR